PGLVRGWRQPAGDAAPDRGQPGRCAGAAGGGRLDPRARRPGRCAAARARAGRGRRRPRRLRMAGLAPVDGWTRWPAPAKLNLFLRSRRRRAAGEHGLRPLSRLLAGGATARLRVRRARRTRRVGASVAGVAADDDLLVKAARRLQSEANAALGADITVKK